MQAYIPQARTGPIVAQESTLSPAKGQNSPLPGHRFSAALQSTQPKRGMNFQRRIRLSATIEPD
jgi:hypothetical protein